VRFSPFSLLDRRITRIDEISEETKGYTAISNSRRFLGLGYRKALPRLLGGFVAIDKNPFRRFPETLSRKPHLIIGITF